jgi:hypothetical protein
VAVAGGGDAGRDAAGLYTGEVGREAGLVEPDALQHVAVRCARNGQNSQKNTSQNGQKQSSVQRVAIRCGQMITKTVKSSQACSTSRYAASETVKTIKGILVITVKSCQAFSASRHAAARARGCMSPQPLP